MATSGVSVFSINTSQLIYQAFYLAEIIAQGDTLVSDDYNVALTTLNMMVKSLQARGYGLWLNQDVVLPLAYQQQSYLLGPSGDNCSASMGETAIASAAVSGASVIAVSGSTGITSGQYIGIQLDDLTMQWTTVNGAPSGNNVTLTAALTAAAAAGNVVFFYTSKIARPLEILDVRLRDVNGIDSPVEIITVDEYKRTLSQKSTYGKPNQVAYDPKTVNGLLYVWETAADVSDRMLITIKRPVYDFVNTTDEPDFPIEWSEALEAGLAARLAYKFPCTAQKKAELKLLAVEKLQEAEDFDRPPYISFMPNYD